MCDNLFGYPFFATFDSLGKILTGLKLLVTLGFPALNTGVIIAVFQTLGNNPPSMDWFIILVIGEVSASLFVLEKTVSISYISFALEHLRVLKAVVTLLGSWMRHPSIFNSVVLLLESFPVNFLRIFHISFAFPLASVTALIKNVALACLNSFTTLFLGR